MDWRTASFLTLAAYGVAMFFVSRANPVHGGKVACFLQMAGYAVLLALMGFGRTDLARMTRTSFALGSAAAGLLVVGTYLMFRAIAVYPEKAALISIIAEGWPLVTALLVHVSGQPLSVREWFGALLISAGMATVSYRPGS